MSNLDYPNYKIKKFSRKSQKPSLHFKTTSHLLLMKMHICSHCACYSSNIAVADLFIIFGMVRPTGALI